jgi:hypothetical protein
LLVHIVLFRPKADLADADREHLVAAIERAHREIAAIRAFRVGRRVAADAGYAATVPDYPYVAVIELDDEAALAAYLSHPAHAELARLFRVTGDSPLAYDFSVEDAARARTLLRF